jgi:hypothetical protein
MHVSTSLCHADKHPSRIPLRLHRLCNHDEADDMETRERRFRESLRPAASTMAMGLMTPTERRGFLLNLLVTKVRKYHTGMLPSLLNFFTFLLSYFIASIEWRIQENCRGAKISQHYLTEIELFTTWECFFTAQCGKCRGRGTGAMRYLFGRL